MSRKISVLGTATSAIWKATVRAWRTSFVPTLIGLSLRLVSDQSLLGSGVALLRERLQRRRIIGALNGRKGRSMMVTAEDAEGGRRAGVNATRWGS